MVVLVVVACWAIPSTARALVVGISDQNPGPFDDRRLATLPIDHARLIVPWDAALTNPGPVDRWLRRAAARRMVPLIAFEHGAGDTCPGSCVLPSPSAYADAFAAFRLRWPAVSEFTPWNEPNYPGQPTSDAPEQAAALHDVLRGACPTCQVIAGDMLDNAGMKSWFSAYRAALATQPLAWGIHNYGDVTYERASYTEWLLGQVTEPVWMTETGGIARVVTDGVERLPYDEDRAARSIDKVFALADAHPERIERAYLYQWRADTGANFDAGLVSPDDSSRPSLERVVARLGLRPFVPDLGDPVETLQPGGEPDRRLRVETAPAQPGRLGAPPNMSIGPGALRPGRPRRTRRGVRITLTCPPERRAGCVGNVTLVLRSSGLRRPRRLASRPVRVAPGSRNLDLRISRTLRRRWSAAARWSITVTTLVRAPDALVQRTWEGRSR